MAHAENTITINKPVAEVYAYLLKGENNPQWRPSVLDIQRLPGKPDGVGAVFKQGLKGPGGRIDGDYEIVEATPNEMIRFQVIAGPARPSGSYAFNSEGKDSTQVTFTLHFEPKGLGRLMEPMINSTMKGEVALLTNLKAVMEGK